MTDNTGVILQTSWGLALKQLDFVILGMQLDLPNKAELGFDAATRDQLTARIEALKIALTRFRQVEREEELRADKEHGARS